MRLATLLCLAAAAFGYEGKYADDPRLAEIRAALPAKVEGARKRVAAALSCKVPAFPLLLEDAGTNRSGVMAETREGPVIVLKTEYLVLDAHDIEKTLAHELVHCLQRKLGGHAKLPLWAREGMAVHVAGQTDERAQALRLIEPERDLVDGLAGPHDLFDYAEDAFAFEVLAARADMPGLLRRLCRDGIDALPLSVARLEGLTAKRARARLAALPPAPPLVRRRALLGRRLLAELGSGDYDPVLARKDLEPFVEYEQALAIIARRAGTRAPSPSRGER